LTLEQLRVRKVLCGPGIGSSVSLSSSAAVEKSMDSLASFMQNVEPVLKENCVRCHGPDHVEGNIRIDTLNPDMVNWP
jgi:hypothetical protein